MTATGCGTCHTCGAALESIPALLKLPAPKSTYNWCPACKTWRFYASHGDNWPAITDDDATPCPKEATS